MSCLRAILHRLRQIDAALLLPALGLVIWGELRPASGEPFALWDKLVHFTAYFGLALMAGLAFRAGRRALWAGLGLVVMGGALEVIQGLVGRDADVFDELANTLGVVAGLGVAFFAVALLRRFGLADAPGLRENSEPK